MNSSNTTTLQSGATAGNLFPYGALKVLLVAWQAVSIMAGSRTVDIKIYFERYDMVPGPGCRAFRRNLMQHGGSAIRVATQSGTR